MAPYSRRGLVTILLSALPLFRTRESHGQVLDHHQQVRAVAARILAWATHGLAFLVAATLASADVPRDLDQYVVLGVREVDLGDGSFVAAGNVGVNAARGVLRFDGDVFVADGTAITGDAVFLGAGSSVFDVFANRLGSGLDAVVVRGAGPVPFAPAIATLPALPIFAPGTTAIAILFEGSRILPPGAYGPVVVGRKGTLVLTGGTYEIESLDVQVYAAVHVLAPSTINIRGDLKMAGFTHIGPARSGVGARDVRVNVGGQSARFGNTSHAAIDMFAPNARVLFSRSFRGEGRFVGDVIQGDETLNFRLTRPPGGSSIGAELCTFTQEDYGAANGLAAPLIMPHPELLPVTIGGPGIRSLTIQDPPRLACFLPTTGTLASLCLRLRVACPIDTIVDGCGSPPILDFNPAGDGSSGGQGAGTFAGEVIAAKLNVALSERGLTAPGLADLVLPTRLCTSKCPAGREVNPNPMKIQTGAVGVSDGITTVGGLIALADHALSVPRCRPGTCSATAATAIFPPNPIRMSDVQNALEVVHQCFQGCATLMPCD